MKQKNILQIMPYFPPHVWGVEKVWEEIFLKWTYGKSLVFSGNSCQQWIVYNEKVGSDQKVFFDSIDIVDNFPLPRLWTISFWKKIKEIKNKIKKNDVIIITHTRFFFSSFMWWVLAKIYKKKWIHIEHGSGYVVSWKKYVDICAYIYDRVFWKFVLKWAHNVLAISKASKDFIVSEFWRKDVNVFYRWMDFFPVEKQDNTVRFLYVWRLTKLKWVDSLLRAYAKLDKKGRLALDIIGDGEQREELEKLADTLNISDGVCFLGSKTRSEVWEYLGENRSVFINPSHQEGMPTTVIEALVWKNVCIASDVWGTREISQHDDLVLFESGNVEQLSQKMLEVVETFDTLEWKSYTHMKKTFSWDKSILELYNMM